MNPNSAFVRLVITGSGDDIKKFVGPQFDHEETSHLCDYPINMMYRLLNGGLVLYMDFDMKDFAPEHLMEKLSREHPELHFYMETVSLVLCPPHGDEEDPWGSVTGESIIAFRGSVRVCSLPEVRTEWRNPETGHVLAPYSNLVGETRIVGSHWNDSLK